MVCRNSPLTNPRRFGPCAVAAVLLTLVLAHPVAAAWKLTPTTRVKAATIIEGQAAITQHDVFLTQLSPFDRMVRMKTDQPVSEAEFLRHLMAEVEAWEPDDLAKLEPAIKVIAEQLAAWRLPWPEEILLVKIRGETDSGAAYCRGRAVMLPPNMLRLPDAAFQRLLLHELFHVLSNQNPDWREKLYALVGFEPCNPIEYPPALRDRKITNPDAPETNYRAELTIDGQEVSVVPILFSSSATYDPQRGGGLFQYLTFRLMEIEEQDGRWVPRLVDGEPVLHDAQATPSYFERIGRNTSYIIHPEEVLADNFALLIQGATDVPTPDLLDRLRAALKVR